MRSAANETRIYKPFIFWLALALAGALPAPAATLFAQAVPEAGMLRYPDVSAERIVFVYAGDLWTVARTGGLASPLASPPGSESNPRFSPDGSQIAFVGNYEAGDDLYVCPSVGGIAQRMTFHPANELLCDWTPSGALLFSSNAFTGLQRVTQLLTISDAEPYPQSLPVPYGSNGAISPDGSWLAYTPYSRDTRTWKRYRGGMASDIWLFHLESHRSQQITDWEGTDTLPMWHGQKVYYLSDAGPNHRLNIWKYDTNTGARQQVTEHADFDVKWPAIGPGSEGQGEIVYQQGSSLRLLDLQSEESVAVKVTIPGDRPRLRPHIVDAAKNIEGASIAPKGERVAVEARGDIWSLPAKNGAPRNLTATSGVAERYPAWSPDGRWIAYFSDATGEYELTIQQSDGRGETRRLTENGAHWRYGPSWSPDSKLIAFTDKTGSIQLHDIQAKTTVQVDKDPSGDRPNLSWTHDSRLIAYAKTDDSPRGNQAIWVYNVEQAESKQLTSGYFNDSEPAFDRKGDFLYYQSNRHFSSPQYEDVGTTFIYRDTGVLLALPLRADVENPLLPEVDEVTWEEEGAKEKSEADDSDAAEKEDAAEEKSDDDGEKGDHDDAPEKEAKDDVERDPLSGSWSLTVDSQLIPPEARSVIMQLTLKADGSLSGTIQGPDGGQLELRDATFDPETSEFSAMVSTPVGDATITATVRQDKMTGTVKISAVGIVADVTATRHAATDGEPDGSDKPAKDAAKKNKKPVTIEFDGAERRVIPLPVAPGDFGALAVNGRHQLLYRRSGNDGPSSIKLFDIHADEPKEQNVAAGGAFEISADGKKLLLMRGSALSISDAGPGAGLGDTVKTNGMLAHVDPRQEWKQVFTDAWRLQRDFFYDPNMHGLDWPAIRGRYQTLLKDATSRSDVGFIISEMISELNVGHAYYRGIPDDPDAPSSDAGLLACRLEAIDGRFRIAEFWQGAAWDTDAQNPLQVAGAKVGQFVLDVEGRPLTTKSNPYAALQGLANRLVAITLSDDPKLDDKDPRIHVQLPGNDSELRFRHWIEKNRAYVDQASDGRIGYIFVTNTGQPGQNDLFRQFYAQLGKDALIIDDRWNGGGQIPTRFIELLNRPATNYWARRDGNDWRWPPDSHQGPKCMLINGLAGSGGDMFPALFRQAKLGPLVGRRTWGGLVGITGSPSLIDGASVTIPSFAYYELDGTWGIEGHGVEPDIDVIDDPARMVDGGDPQLDAAIDYLHQELKSHPYQPPQRPAYPDRRAMGIPKQDQ